VSLPTVQGLHTLQTVRMRQFKVEVSARCDLELNSIDGHWLRGGFADAESGPQLRLRRLRSFHQFGSEGELVRLGGCGFPFWERECRFSLDRISLTSLCVYTLNLGVKLGVFFRVSLEDATLSFSSRLLSLNENLSI
jgi:hypothetical protein